LLPIVLEHYGQKREALGLLDTGADVLPYQLGLELGAVWEEQQTAIQLSGNLANFEARGIVMNATISDFASVRLAFAWTRAEVIPLLLGQVNFFMEYDVCFYRSSKTFEVTRTQ
jgi:hypothetical protein